MLHNRKIDKDPSLQLLFNELRRELENKLTIHQFVRWTAANPSITAPILMLQLHLRLQIIGEKFWIKMTDNRKSHPEQGKIDYVKKLQAYVIQKNKQFHERLTSLEQERRRLSRLGKAGYVDSRENITRKESMLLGHFSMKRRLTRIAPSASSKARNVQKTEEKLYHKFEDDYDMETPYRDPQDAEKEKKLDELEQQIQLLEASGKLKNETLSAKKDAGSPSQEKQAIGPSEGMKKRAAASNGDSKKKKQKNKEPTEKEIAYTQYHRQKRRKSILDIFDPKKKNQSKQNSEILHEEEVHVGAYQNVPLRRRRSVFVKPKLIRNSD